MSTKKRPDPYRIPHKEIRLKPMEAFNNKRSIPSGILKARMKCVDTACDEYLYSGQDISDYISDDDLKGTLGVIRPDASDGNSDPSNDIPSAKVNGEKLLRNTKNS